MMKTAAVTDKAQSAMTIKLILFAGALSPKLAKRMTSQNTRTQ